MAVIDYNDFKNWCLIKEPSLVIENEETADKNISDYSSFQLQEGFNDAVDRCKLLNSYMSSNNFRSLIYNYGLHIAIANSFYENENNNEQDLFEITEPEEALQRLYIKYSVNSATIGITTSSSSGGSSASSQLPKVIADGDLETSFLLSTPYGKRAEIFFEQIQGVII